MKDKHVPKIQSTLRHNTIIMPNEIYNASGIIINGRRIKTLIFSTDLAIICNCNADAVLAVYPFTPQRSISDGIIKYANIPVFCGVGGGTTNGERTIPLAKDAECQGAIGIILNSPITNENILSISECVDIPIVITIVNGDTNIGDRLRSGASILNVAGGRDTPEIVRKIRLEYPTVPIIASGGNTGESILRTIDAGANAITYTPPSTATLFKQMMEKYRLTND
ncbi:MAG: hydrolase [Ruminococcus sp.]|nr:hydrolase [Candidatus Copronaster equi]